MDNSLVVLPFAKKSGLTSFTSLNAFKTAFNTKKVGHSGTLDSFADGVMIALINKATRLAPFFLSCDKTYKAQFLFGVETDTLDPEGSIVAQKDLPTVESLKKALPNFLGKIAQVPPTYSSVHVNGKRASDRAREGEEITLKERFVKVYAINLLDLETIVEGEQEKVKKATLEINCSKGTYVRSLCRDIARLSGSCGLVLALRRLSIGSFSLETCFAHNELEPFDVVASHNYKKLFSRENILLATEKKSFDFSNLQSFTLHFTKDIAKKINISICDLKREWFQAFVSGQKINRKWFTNPLSSNYKKHLPSKNGQSEKDSVLLSKTTNECMSIEECIEKEICYAVFCEENFCGIINFDGKRFSYHFVVS